MTLAHALFLVAILDDRPFGTVKTVTGAVTLSSHGVHTALTKKSIGKALMDGDLVLVARNSTLVVKLTNGASQSFAAKPTWQNLLIPVVPGDAKAYKAVQSAFDVAVIRRGGGGFVFPSGPAVPCSLFTIVGQSGPFKVTAYAAGAIVVYDAPELNQPMLARALTQARDSRHITTVRITAGSSILDSPLMPLDEEAELLAQLKAAKRLSAEPDRHLARALAFAHHRLYEFARYEVDQLPKLAQDAILTPRSRSIASIRPAQ